MKIVYTKIFYLVTKYAYHLQIKNFIDTMQILPRICKHFTDQFLYNQLTNKADDIA